MVQSRIECVQGFRPSKTEEGHRGGAKEETVGGAGEEERHQLVGTGNSGGVILATINLIMHSSILLASVKNEFTFSIIILNGMPWMH